jgi:hypothetical protein
MRVLSNVVSRPDEMRNIAPRSVWKILKAFASQDIFDETFLRVNTAKVSIPVF